MNYFSIGEVSKKFNISLRTLRYYDEIGLLQPAVKEENGKRFYSPENLLTLEKITLLKTTSLHLTDIQNILKESNIHSILSLHKKILEKEIQQLQQSVSHTTTLLNILYLEGNLDWEQLLPLVKKDTTIDQEKKEIVTQFFNQDEQVRLKEMLPKLEDDHITSEKWIRLMKRIILCAEKKLPPNSEEAQLLAADIQLLTEETFNGDRQLADKFWEARKSEKHSQAMNLYPIKKEVLDYIETVMAIYEESKQSLS